ncbi:MAG TPA: hypothetical protein VI957_02015 [Candidatus Paceibacterota bacterium]
MASDITIISLGGSVIVPDASRFVKVYLCSPPRLDTTKARLLSYPRSTGKRARGIGKVLSRCPNECSRKALLTSGVGPHMI